MRGRLPKPEHLRRNRTKKPSRATLTAPEALAPPTIPNPDGREWHPLTLEAWAHAWASPMASQWLETDADALGRLALLWDLFYAKPSAEGLKEIRLQGALFGLSPQDRNRLQWTISRADEAEQRQAKRAQPAAPRTGRQDPRRILQMVVKK